MNAETPTSALAGNIPVREFLRAFPFYLAWNAQNRIVEVGPSLRKVCPCVEPAQNLTDALRLVRPHGELSASFFNDHRDQLFVLEDRTNQRLLRGGYLPLEQLGLGVFLGTPWMTSPDQIAAHGLALGDFAVHDQTLDLLLLLQTQQTAANDLRQLNAKLVAKREQLIEQEARARKLALVASSTDNAVILTDGEMRFEWVNEAFTRMTGWSALDVRQEKLWDFLIHSAAEPISFSDAENLLNKGLIFHKELPQFRRDGSCYWLSIEVQRLRDDAREVASLMAIGRDVTEKKQAEKRLRRREMEARRQRDEAHRQRDELEWIYNNAPIGLCYLDKDLRYRRVNRYLAEINGVGVEEHIGRSVGEVVPSFATRIEREARNVIRTRRPARYEDVTYISSAEHSRRYFNESWCPAFDEKGEVSGMTLLVEEVTDQRRLLLLGEADQRKNAFLATLAHELRNPLAPIKSALQLVQMSDADDLMRDENLAALRIAERQVDHLVRLVDDLLEVARITHGKIRLKKENIDLLDVLPQALDLVRPLLLKQGHQLTYEAPTPPLPVSGDSVRLVQVFANLLENAIKYTPPGGVISLSVAIEGAEAIVRVKDNGRGIPPEKLASIWDLFAQVEYGTREARGGIGIGLALARTITELHNGRVGATSLGIGMGSEFFVGIPLAVAS
ncbi:MULTISPECIES: PAS domain-containing protein [unclassified Methylocystis]|uniref:PAS domain-containing protein n=1 Tax=unclassified Methylocystis TaxID=2625913 RepID=UPI00311A02ED